MGKRSNHKNKATRNGSGSTELMSFERCKEYVTESTFRSHLGGEPNLLDAHGIHDLVANWAADSTRNLPGGFSCKAGTMREALDSWAEDGDYEPATYFGRTPKKKFIHYLITRPYTSLTPAQVKEEQKWFVEHDALVKRHENPGEILVLTEEGEDAYSHAQDEDGVVTDLSDHTHVYWFKNRSALWGAKHIEKVRRKGGVVRIADEGLELESLPR